MIKWEDAVKTLINDKSQAELVTANYFDPPLSKAAKRYADGAEWQAVRIMIGKANGVAVDIGAGNGIVSYALARDGWETVAIEPDPSDLVGAGAIRRLSKEAGLQIDVQEGVGENLMVKSGSASLVIARQVLHHANDLYLFVSEIQRILKPGGILVSLRDHVISGPEQLPIFLANHPLHSLYGGENAYQIQEYRSAFTAAKLKIVSELRSFDSIVNYAPKSKRDLRGEISKRLGAIGPIARLILAIPSGMEIALKLMTMIDRRPGRLVSFICQKA
jgi:SAM-dependent methyltransferase